MSDLTDYSETEFRDWMSQGVSTDTPPDPIYIGLHTSDPGESPDGSTEVSAADYSRVGVAADTGWATPTTSSFENASEVTFGEATNDWGTVSHVALWDDTQGAAGETAIAAYALDTSKAINTGDEAVFRAGDLSFSLD
jgi:hypothetical protein